MAIVSVSPLARSHSWHASSLSSAKKMPSAPLSSSSSMTRNSCCSSPGALASSAAAGAGASRGGAAPAARQEKKQGRSLMIKARPFSTSTSPPSTTAAAAAAAKKASPLLLPSLALPKFYSGAKLRRAKAKLLDLVSRSERGTNTGPSGPSRGEIEAAIDEVYAAAPRSALFPLENDPAGIDGKWKLVWTSEKEVLWVIANGQRLFGVQEVGEVFQTLSLGGASSNNGNENGKKEPTATAAPPPALVNEIVFPPGGSFVVNSGARARGSASDREKGTPGSRVDFKFSGARLDVAKVDERTGACAPAFSLPLPPFGSGWFDTVVVGGDLRIARDVRGDTLICVRAEEGE